MRIPQCDLSGWFVFIFLICAWLLASSVHAQHLQHQEWLKQIQSASARWQPSLHQRRNLRANASSWNTLSGSVPLVIANGGMSGLFPDQTQIAYMLTTANSLPGTVLLCDLQLLKDGSSLCRTGIDLSLSTNINLTMANLTNQYTVNGEIVQGFFAIDLTKADLPNIQATQSNSARPPWYDGIFSLLQLENVSAIAAQAGSPVWVNVEYYSFFKQHQLDIALYLGKFLQTKPPISFISSPSIAFLKAMAAAAPKNLPKLIFRFNAKQDVEMSTNVTYGSLLTNLTYIATFSSGILVPKDFIWPVDSTTSYLETESMLIRDAHAAHLLVFASDFISDEINGVYVPIYNYSFDPILEYLQYLPATGPTLDGFLTDFSATASEAIACYTGSSTKLDTKTKTIVISHNGASGDYPGCTMLAYKGAVEDGANFIDCSVQITKDGVPICRESPDLIPNTDITSHTDLYPSRLTRIPELQSTAGIFTFNMTAVEINTLNAKIFSPVQERYNISRNPAYTQEQILTLADFLDYAKNLSDIGIFIDIQNGYFLITQVGLDVVGSVLSVLDAAGLNKSRKVTIQSEDSAVLQRLKQLTSYQLVYRVSNDTVSITQEDVQAIRALAPVVTLPRGLVQETTNSSLLLNSTSVVDLFHRSNMTILVSYLRNEFVFFPFDYMADPTVELNTLIQILQVDGVITDFPATARAYLNNACLKVNSDPTGLNYSMFPVVPGDLLYNVPTNIGPPPSKNPVYASLNVSENEKALPPTVIGESPNPASAPGSSSLPKSPGSLVYPVSGLVLLLISGLYVIIVVI